MERGKQIPLSTQLNTSARMSGFFPCSCNLRFTAYVFDLVHKGVDTVDTCAYLRPQEISDCFYQNNFRIFIKKKKKKCVTFEYLNVTIEIAFSKP